MKLHTEITEQPIDVSALIAFVQSPACGAVASFLGVVRDHGEGRQVLRLDYEAYVPMAELGLRRIAHAAAARHQLGGVALVHRLGTLRVGEVSVAVITASAHRAQAFAACREALEAIKRELPVWKREHHPDGAVWVDARCAAEPDDVQAAAHAH